MSLISLHWLKDKLPHHDYEIRPVSELLCGGLKVEGAGRNLIPYVGYTVLNFQLYSGGTDGGVSVPFLVCKERLRQPLIGYNVIEAVVGSVGNKDNVLKRLLTSLPEHDTASVVAISEQFTELQLDLR